MTMTRFRFTVVALLVAVIVGTVGVATRFVSADTPIFGAQTSASPEASPMASPSASGLTIEMVDIAFKPNTLTIGANTDATVTIRNTGVTTHTFVINDHKNEGKPNLNIKVEVAPGATETVTINAPAGDYYFWCDIPGHEAAGMFGTLTVQ
jgi:uncharacterized cupredoxin-like copper-binding protein